MTATLDQEVPSLDLTDLQIDEEPTPTRTRKPRSDAGKPRGRRSPSVGLLADQLLIPWGTVALAASQAVPLVSAVMLDRGEATMKALVEIASDHPKMLGALKKAAKAGPASELFQTGAMLLLAAAIETGRVPVDASIAQRTGLTNMYYDVHPDRAPDVEKVNTSAMPFSAPGM